MVVNYNYHLFYKLIELHYGNDRILIVVKLQKISLFLFVNIK